MHILPRFLLVLTSAALAHGCGGDDAICGPGDVSGVVVGDLDGTELRYGELESSANNDCGEPGGPVSLTVEARQEGTERLLILCLPRPDDLDGPVDLGDDSRVQVIDVFADVDDCLVSIDRSRAAAGTVSFAGVCDDGRDPAGYAITFDAELPVLRSCPGSDDEAMTMSLTGAAPVAETTP